MYTDKNFRTKKELKEAVLSGHCTVRVYQPNDMFRVTERISQGKHTVTLEGPHYPEAHRWYGTAECVDGCVVKVK